MLDTVLLGVVFSHGQEGDQFSKTDRAFCHLDVRRMLAAAGFSRSLRLEDFLRQRIRKSRCSREKHSRSAGAYQGCSPALEPDKCQLAEIEGSSGLI
jgi:hypothetical protein